MSDFSAPLVSVIMNCYNGQKYLEEAIKTVFSQTYLNWEIIFWDNASTDESASIAKRYLGKLKYFRSDVNVPLYAARALALKKCQGELIAFLDCDDLWFSDKLTKQVPLFENKRVGLVYSDSIFFDDGGDKGRNFTWNTPCRGQCFRELLTRYFLDIETVVVRKTFLEQYTLTFDDRFQLIGDAHLFTLLAYYTDIDFCPEVLSKWRIHQGNLSKILMGDFSIESEKMLVAIKDKIPQAVIEYPDDFQKAQDNIQVQKALQAWRSLSLGEMRNALRKVINPTWKSTFLYVLTFFHRSVAAVFYKYYQRNTSIKW